MEQTITKSANSRHRAIRAFLIGGIFPVVAFTLVENYYGTWWGLVAGMVFGVGEIITELLRDKRVDTMTWIGNGMLFFLGGISLFTNEGIWFKLQPALMEAGMAILMFGSLVMKRPFLLMAAKKQGTLDNIHPEVLPTFTRLLSGLTFRVGIFFLFHALLATWAAYYWSTAQWAFLKGVGFTASMFVYLFAEVWWMRRRMRR